MNVNSLQQMIQLQAMSQINPTTTDSTTANSGDQFSNLLSSALTNQNSSTNYNQSLGLLSGLANNEFSADSYTGASTVASTDASQSLASLGSTLLAALNTNGSNPTSQIYNSSSNLGAALSSSNVAAVYDNYRNTYASNAIQTETIAPITKTATSKTDFDAIIEKASATFGIPEKMIRSVIQQESSFNSTAVSSAGATGLMQLMPATAKSLGVTNATDPEQNIMAGTKYLKQMLNQFGDYKTMLAAYNAGPGNVNKYGGIPPFTETQNYVSKIMASFNA